ncbi:MAG: hypothetical protein HYV65_02970 [Candidatus Spechtbacteria bacterium]|nr:hypothetical protein [Candidatus Spechtbacteria bacterium]
MKHLFLSTIAGLTIGITLVAYSAFAWAPPVQAPPNGNTAPPINTSAIDQSKAGSLLANGGVWAASLGVSGGAQFFGNIMDGSSNIIYDSSTKKIPAARLPFNQGDLIAPGDRPLISGLASYLTSYFNIANLGISGTTASNVRQGVTFGPGNSIVGTATSSLIGATLVDIYEQKIFYGPNETYTLTATCPAGKTIAAAGRGSAVVTGGSYGIVGAERMAWDAVIKSIPVAACQGATSCSQGVGSGIFGGDTFALRVSIWCL